ncbi:hypothetical protein F5144DRAFT_533270 [Chaetomium tenue]|uniref:Uncharacterized protein n=1 Tax=Chaetomium tenue TaxID=1854479 RepID=A0ACB7P9C1_9PEZI|nr:hypothetical protein F5144DRAFT_533270 [Chaetomium globosum]
MGCCLSRDGGPNSPYPGGAATGSGRAINEATQTAGASSSQTGIDESLPSGSQRRRRQSHQPLNQHINKPLRRHEWVSRDRQWTSAALRRERIEFFDTRVTGREEIWQTLRAALEVLWAADEVARNSRHQRVSEDGGPSEEDPVVALATAQSIIDAADITLPTGDLHNGAYDAFGNYYQLPHQIVADPSNLLRSPSSTEGLGDAKTDLAAGEETEREYGDDDDEVERRREEKGKAVVDIRHQITIKARLSDGSRDVSVAVNEGDTVRRIARAIAEQAKNRWSPWLDDQPLESFLEIEEADSFHVGGSACSSSTESTPLLSEPRTRRRDRLSSALRHLGLVAAPGFRYGILDGDMHDSLPQEEIKANRFSRFVTTIETRRASRLHRGYRQQTGDRQQQTDHQDHDSVAYNARVAWLIAAMVI